MGQASGNARRSPAGTPRLPTGDVSLNGLDDRPFLAFDTSGPWCAAALLVAGRVIHRQEPMEKGQAERLMPLLEDLLAEGDIGWGNLGGLAVGTGPGNFTGVRIAVAAARGLALGLGIPAIGVTRLEALAHGLPRPVTVVEDARRGEVYVQAFGMNGQTAATLTERTNLPSAPGLHVVGSAAAGLGAVLEPRFALAEAILRIALDRRAILQPRPSPFYLRGADATPSSDPPVVILDA
jgi:tRNA threonylcarbamoyladenosine biosynthesis protein TsaB